MNMEVQGRSEEIKNKAKRVAKIATVGVGLVTGLAAGAVEIHKGLTEMSEREKTYESIEDLAMTTPLERAEADGFKLELPEMTPEREAEIAAVDGGYTDLVTSDGHLSTFAKTCGYDVTREDGATTVMLDALKCNDFYADQYRLDDSAVQAIADAYGYTPAEITFHGEIMRQSIVSHPSVVTMPGFESLVAVQYYDGLRFSPDWKPYDKEIYDGYYKDASALTFSLIQGLDLTHADAKTKQAVKEAIADLIKANITRENTTLIVADDITNLSQETDRQGLIEGFTESEHGNNPGLFHQPRIQDLHDAEKQAQETWSKLVSFEPNRTGPVHALAEAHLNAHNEITSDILKAGEKAGLETDFLHAELVKRVVAQDVGDSSDGLATIH